MRLYCCNRCDDEENNYLNDWFNAGTDIDDFIFYDEAVKISEK